MPLYAAHESLGNPWWRCFIASLGDGVLVLLIFTAGWAIWRQPDWFERPRAAGYSLMLAVGFVIAVAIEWLALAERRWSYAASMPTLPLFGIGITPVAQMLVLPPFILALRRVGFIEPRQLER